MRKWRVNVLTIEKGYVSFNVKADSKGEAVKKGLDIFTTKNLTYANKFNCTLCR